MSDPLPDTHASRRLSPRHLLILLALLAAICASVLLADHLSQRNRAAPLDPAKGNSP